MKNWGNAVTVSVRAREEGNDGIASTSSLPEAMVQNAAASRLALWAEQQVFKGKYLERAERTGWYGLELEPLCIRATLEVD